jgi:autotransporter-associated beta strand protein
MKKILTLLLSLLSIISISQVTIVNYDFNSGSSYATLSPALASGITCGASSTEAYAFNGGIATGVGAFTSNSTAGNDLTMTNSSGTNTKYFQFSLGGASLSNYNTFKIYFQGRRSGTGAQLITVQYSLNGGAYTNFASNTMSPGNGSFLEATFNLPIAVDNPSTSLSFRLLASGASGNGTLRLDNFQVQAVNSPATSTVLITAQDPNTPTPVNWAIGSTLNQFYWAAVTPSMVAATLNSVTANMTGNYVAADIATNGLKLYYSSDATFIPAGDVLLSSQSSAKVGATETITWSGLSQSFSSGTTGYIYATADISGSANAGNTLAGSFGSNTNVVFSPTVAYNSGNTYGSTTDKTFASLPTNPTIFNVNCSSQANIKVNMNAPTVGSVLVFANTGTTFTVPTGSGSGFTGANSNYGSATNYPAVGGRLVYSGAGANFTVTGLTLGQTYSLIAYSYSGSTWSSGTSVITGTAITQPVTATVVTPSSGQVNLSWTNPSSSACNNNVIVIARQGTAVESSISKANFDGLVSDVDFTGANATWTLNSNTNDVFDLTAGLIGTDNTNFLIYKGTGNSVTINGLTNGTTYFFRIFTVDGNGSSARWSNAVDASGTPDVPGYFWNGGNISAIPANGGSGTWGTSNAWRQPGASGSPTTWVDGNPAVFSGNAGVVTLDASRSATGYSFNTSSYTLQTTSSTGINLTGPISISTNQELVLAPNLPSTTFGVIGVSSINGSGTSSVVIYGNPASSIENSRINLASANSTINVPTEIKSNSGLGMAGYVSTSVGGVINGNIINNSNLRTMIGATSGNDLTINGVISGSSGLQFSAGQSGGIGTILLNSPNTYAGNTIFNTGNAGLVSLGVNNGLPVNTNLTMAFSSSNGGIFNLNGFNQIIGNLANGIGGGSITNNSSTSNSTLSITQTTIGSFNRPITDGSGGMKLGIIKNGSSLLTLNGTGYTFSGGMYLNAGELRFNPSSSPVALGSCPMVLNGGVLGTSGITASSVLNFSTLDVEGTTTISLAASAHTLNFANSNGVAWTSGTGQLDIIGWTGTYTTMPGSSGTNGKIFVGSSASALTAAQLSKIRFFDGVDYYRATLLSTGELVPNGKLTKLSTAFCAYTSTSTSEFIWADSLGTPSTQSNWRYLFKLVNGASTFTWQTNNEWPIMQFYNFPGLSINTTYTASVAWSDDNGSTFSAYGPTCAISSPVSGTTNISSATCGSTLTSFSSPIFADGNGASQYEFQLVNSALSYTQTKVNTSPNCNLSMFTGITNSATYNINVRAFVMGVWSPYGPTCTITAPNSATTQLSPGSCGSSPSSLTSGIFANSVTGASQYEYKLTNSSLSYTSSIVRTAPNFNLSMFSGLQNSTTYSAQVRVNIGGSWGSYGAVCTLTTPAIPTTSLSSGSCGSSPATFITGIFANAVTGATQYEYRLINSSLSYTSSITRGGSNFNLSMFTGLQNSTTYTSDVRVFVGGSWGNYGAVCTLTTPGIPTTSLSAGSCNSFPTSYYTSGLFVNQVPGATQYEYTLYNTANSYTSVITRTASNFNLGMFSPLPAVSTTYSVIVRVNQGTGFGTYGALCTVTSPGTQAKLGGANEVEFAENANDQSTLKVVGELNNTFIEALVFPNPVKESFQIVLTNYQVNEPITINVFDAMGRLIERKTDTAESIGVMHLGTEYAKGIYNVVIVQGNSVKNIKVVKE